MIVFRNSDKPLAPPDPASFIGNAQAKLLASSDAGASVHVYRVEFGKNARTNWHRHTGPQWLLVIAGRIRIQLWGSPPHELQTGDAVVIEPGEKHWHGAASGLDGAHMAINVNATTEWLEAVSDEQYAGSD